MQPFGAHPPCSLVVVCEPTPTGAGVLMSLRRARLHFTAPSYRLPFSLYLTGQCRERGSNMLTHATCEFANRVAKRIHDVYLVQLGLRLRRTVVHPRIPSLHRFKPCPKSTLHSTLAYIRVSIFSPLSFYPFRPAETPPPGHYTRPPQRVSQSEKKPKRKEYTNDELKVCRSSTYLTSI